MHQNVYNQRWPTHTLDDLINIDMIDNVNKQIENMDKHKKETSKGVYFYLLEVHKQTVDPRLMKDKDPRRMFLDFYPTMGDALY